MIKFIILISVILFVGCKVDSNTADCNDDFIISKDNYNYFLNNTECFKKKIYIAIMRVGKDTLSNIIKDIYESDSITSLSISNVQIKYVPNELFRFKRLEELEIISCGLEFIDKNINNLTRLVSLDLSKNKLEDIVFVNEHLRYINVSYNKISKLPTCFIKLKGLKQINLNYNFLTDLPVNQLNWDSVKVVSIYGNNIDSLTIEDLKLKFNKVKVINHRGVVE